MTGENKQGGKQALCVEDLLSGRKVEVVVLSMDFSGVCVMNAWDKSTAFQKIQTQPADPPKSQLDLCQSNRCVSFNTMVANNLWTLEPWAWRWNKEGHVNFREKNKLTLTADVFLILEADKTETKLIPSKHFSSLDVWAGRKKQREDAFVCLVAKDCGNKCLNNFQHPHPRHTHTHT